MIGGGVMDARTRESVARKLRALADRIEAGEDVGDLFYSYDPETGYTSGMPASVAQADASASLEHFRDQASEGWRDDVGQIEWGVMVPIEAARMVMQRQTPCSWDHDFMCDYALVDPDEYTGPDEEPPDTCGDCDKCCGEAE